jgi:hypothetical protein
MTLTINSVAKNKEANLMKLSLELLNTEAACVRMKNYILEGVE